MPMYQIRLKNQLGLTVLFRAKPAIPPLARSFSCALGIHPGRIQLHANQL